MYRMHSKSIKAEDDELQEVSDINNPVDKSEVLYTPAALLDLLSQVDEFKDFDLSIVEGLDGTLQLQVGESYYELASKDELEVEVDEEILDEIDNLNEQTYKETVDLDESDTPIEGGLIKEALKTLLIGGVVRMAKSYLQSK